MTTHRQANNRIRMCVSQTFAGQPVTRAATDAASGTGKPSQRQPYQVEGGHQARQDLVGRRRSFSRPGPGADLVADPARGGVPLLDRCVDGALHCKRRLRQLHPIDRKRTTTTRECINTPQKPKRARDSPTMGRTRTCFRCSSAAASAAMRSACRSAISFSC